MVHYFRANSRMHCGPDKSWERQNDRADPSSDTKQSREPAGPYQTIRDQHGDSGQAEVPYHGLRPKDRFRGANVTALFVEVGAIIVDFNRHTLLPLDDCNYASQPTVPRLTRSLLHRCSQLHGFCRLTRLFFMAPYSDVQRK